MISAENKDKLNCMNYQVSTYEGHYYLQYGLMSLKAFSESHRISYIELCLELLDKGYYTLSDKNTEITMI